MTESLPADQAARDEIRDRLDIDLFVEAGAGSGKTTALVERVLALVTAADVSMARIAAITFTEKAATELRDRIRQALERAAAEGGDPTIRAKAALDELDGAAISTLHAFAQRLLNDCPIEAGLPPRFEVHDELASQVAFDARWADFVDRLLDDPDYDRALLFALAAGIKLGKLRELALAANSNWDLVERERIHELREVPPPLVVAPLLDEIAAILALRDQCNNSDDLLLLRFDEFDAYARRLRAANDEFDTLALLFDDSVRLSASGKGRAGNWTCDVKEVRARVNALADLRQRLRDDVAISSTRHLTAAIAGFVLESARTRERAGTLEFHDLLVLARRLLRSPEHSAMVRARLDARYERLLLDEFQDTDPIQIDLAVLLATRDPDAHLRPWTEIATEPGRLFVVGDPKQSIYRFRRADISLFLQARERLGAHPRRLTSNFRTVAPVIEWVNHTFGRLIQASPESQPEYVPLDPVRGAPPTGPAVTLLGIEPHAPRTTADEQRTAEAHDVVDAIRTAMVEQWPIADVLRNDDGSRTERWRAPKLGDIAILLPARTSLGHLEDALDAAGIAYRAETSSLVYTTREIHDLLVLLHAIDDPTDALAVVTALRSALFGCGDDDLFAFRVQHGGSWNPFAPPPDTLAPEHPVVAGITYLHALGKQKHWLTPSELLDKIVRDRRVLEVAFASGRPRDVWRRVRFVIDQARAYSEAEGGSLRDFLEWAERQGDEGSRVVETVLPETDDDAVRILTIHGAKGLEFPIAILSGTTTKAVNRASGVRLVFPPTGGWGVRIDKRVQTEEYQRFEPIDEQMDFHEKLRLLYVAATRARDHLVVSVHRAERKPVDDLAKSTHAELLWSAAHDAPNWEVLTPTTQPLPALTAPTAEPLIELGAWRAERDAALANGRAHRVQSATRLAREANDVSAAAELAAPDPGLDKEPRDLELPPWLRGRYGTAIGRAVHAVLQTVDLRTGAGIDEAAAAQAAAESVIGHEDRIAALARAALATDTVREAVASEYRRETYVATTLGDRTLEGYIDLVYRAPDGLVVVDYKTDAVATDTDVAEKLARYRLQAAAYAVALEAATGERVARCVFLFLQPRGAREVAVNDLDQATAEVRALIAS